MFDVVAMPWTWPVEVNHHEAKAFCAWRGTDYRLAIEAEHVVMRGSKVNAVGVIHKGAIQDGCGGVKFSGRNPYEGVRFNVIRIAKVWVVVQFPGKSVA